MVPIQYIRDGVSKEVLRTVRDHNAAGRKYSKQAFALGHRIIRTFLKIIVDKIIDGGRILLPDGKILYIGVIPHNPNMISKWKKKKRLNLHTQGKRYGVKLVGIQHDAYFRMPQRRRTELANKISQGFNYLD